MHSNGVRSWVHSHITAAFFFAFAFSSPSSSLAAEVPWTKQRFEYTTDKKDLRDFFRDFSLAVGVTIIIDGKLEGKVSGTFDHEPRALLDLMAHRHGFIWYYDGLMIHITPGVPHDDEETVIQADHPNAQSYTAETSARSSSQPIPTYVMESKKDKPVKTPASRTTELPAITENKKDKLAKAPASRTTELPNLIQASPIQNYQADSKPAQLWEISPSDNTLNGAMARWSALAGWQLLWELPIDYAIDVRTTIMGTFTEAVEIVAKNMERAEVPLKVIFYKGNKVVRIVSKGVE